MPKKKKAKPTNKSSKLAVQRQEQIKKMRSKNREINLDDVGDETEFEKKSQVSDEPTSVRGRGDSGKILLDPHRMRSDIKLVEQSIKKGWNVQRKTMIRRRMEDIVRKTEAEVVTKDGVIISTSAADKIAIEATKVLVSMDSQDQTRVKNDKGELNPTPSTTVNINVTNSVDERRLGIARLAQRFGARELVVDGEAIPISEITGEIDSLEGNEMDDGKS